MIALDVELEFWLQERTQENRDRLFERYRYLCARGARKFWRRGADRADLEQIAAIGLIKACDRYNGRLNTPFEAFAWLFVVGELMHHVRDHERLVRAPRRLRELDRRYQDAHDALVMQLQREPSTGEIAGLLQIAPREVEDLTRYRAQAVPESLDAMQTHEFHPSTSPLDEREDRLMAEAALESLTRTERVIVLALYASGYSQVEISQRLGYSRRHISRLHRSALRKMQPHLVSKSAYAGTDASASMSQEKQMKHQRGFTLLEMMVVVAIIAILAAVLIPNFTHARAQAATSACMGNLKTIATAFELYYTDKQAYPAGSGSIDGSMTGGTGALAGYLGQPPEDPAAGTGKYYTYSTASSAGVDTYDLWCPGTHDSSTLAPIAAGSTDTTIKYDSAKGLTTASGPGK